jgi:hypothetical protein
MRPHVASQLKAIVFGGFLFVGGAVVATLPGEVAFLLGACLFVVGGFLMVDGYLRPADVEREDPRGDGTDGDGESPRGVE